MSKFIISSLHRSIHDAFEDCFRKTKQELPVNPMMLLRTDGCSEDIEAVIEGGGGERVTAAALVVVLLFFYLCPLSLPPSRIQW